MKVRHFLRNFNQSLFLAGVLLGTAACEKGPKLIPEIEGSNFSLLAFQSQTSENWVIGIGNELRTKSTALSFGGACSGDVKSMKVFINGTETGSAANCANSGYLWSQTGAVGGDGTYNVDLVPYSEAGIEVPDKRISKIVQVDNVGPSGIAFSEILYYKDGSLVNEALSNASSPSIMIDADSDGCTDGKLGVRLTGTYTPSGDPAVLDQIVISPAGGMTFHSGGVFDFRFCMTAGENRSVSIQAVDDLGNASNILTTAISASSPMTSIKVGGSFNPGFSGSSVAAEPGITDNGMTLVSVHMGNVVASASSGGMTLSTGFTGVLSQASP